MVKLGAKYKDIITGFEGIATGAVKYITGCDQILLAPPAKSGSKPDSEWFDVNRISRVGKSIVKVKTSADNNNKNDDGPDIEAPRK